MTAAAHASPPDAGLRPAGEQDYELSGRPLRPGTSLGSTARFGDDWWDLRPAQLQHQDKALSLNFANVPERYRADAKNLFRLLLNGPHPAGIAETSIGTIRQKLSALASFWSWLDDRAPGPGPTVATLAGRDFEDYHRRVLATTRSRSLRANRKSAVRLLWFYRRQISDGLAFDPSQLDDWAEPHTGERGENRTDRIPESVTGPLLAWSLRFIRDFAGDILQAAAEAAPLHAAGQRSRGLHHWPTCVGSPPTTPGCAKNWKPPARRVKESDKSLLVGWPLAAVPRRARSSGAADPATVSREEPSRRESVHAHLGTARDRWACRVARARRGRTSRISWSGRRASGTGRRSRCGSLLPRLRW